ncbi:MAG: hypothetical protein M1325_02255 [Actinobacteria bacterium]|nr:hypothetical protein [Actinomycetota bacterium]
MGREGGEVLAREIKDLALSRGAFRVGIADAVNGFSRAVAGCRPRDLMPGCRSVVCLAVHVGTGYYELRGLSTHTGGEPLGRPADWLSDSITLEVSQLLYRRGAGAYVVPAVMETTGGGPGTRSPLKLRQDTIVPFSIKLAAYEAGLGVYGRNSTVLTPEYGPQVYFRVILTDCELTYDRPLEGFDPCAGCRVCATLCPARAIDPAKEPPHGHDRVRCKAFVYSLPEFSSNPVVRRCGLCTDRCRLAKPGGFTGGAHHTLADLTREAVESLRALILASESHRRRVEEFEAWDGNLGLG